MFFVFDARHKFLPPAHTVGSSNPLGAEARIIFPDSEFASQLPPRHKVVKATNIDKCYLRRIGSILKHNPKGLAGTEVCGLHSCFSMIHYVSSLLCAGIVSHPYDVIDLPWHQWVSQYSRGNLHRPLNVPFFFKLVSYSRQVRNKAFSKKGTGVFLGQLFSATGNFFFLQSCNRNYGNYMASSSYIWIGAAAQPRTFSFFQGIEHRTSLLFMLNLSIFCLTISSFSDIASRHSAPLQAIWSISS